MIFPNRLYIVDCNSSKEKNEFHVVLSSYYDKVYICFKGTISECLAFLEASNKGHIISVDDLPESEQNKIKI